MTNTFHAAILALAFAAASPAATAAAIPPANPVDLGAAAVMRLPAPPVQRYRARDGAQLAYRSFTVEAASPPVVAILLHGSGGSSLNMTVLGETLARAGVPALAPDARGQGLSGRRGDIDYIGQLDDDLADFVTAARKAYPDARFVLVGHSAGGGFALRVAGGPQGRLFSRFVLLSPVLGRLAPTNRPDAGWAKPKLARIAVISALNGVGITRFNGATAIDFNLPPGAEALGLTRAWSYRMMINYDPRGVTQLAVRPAYRRDAARAAAPIAVIAGAADEQFFAERYAAAFAGLPAPVMVELVSGVSHMGVVSDPRATPLIVAAVKAGG